MEAPPLRWGIIGAGSIAGKFTEAVTKYTRSSVVAVGSRDKARAQSFATLHNIDSVHEGYESLVDDISVEAVYIATPHSLHKEHALLAIASGKPVLVEKPISTNAANAAEIVAAARSANVFLMEGMWSRFLPHLVMLKSFIEEGQIGHPVYLHAEHGQQFRFDPKHRIYDPVLGGGALLDLGIYPASFAQYILGAPTKVGAMAATTETGVDGLVTMVLQFPESVHAALSTTLWSNTAISAGISGTEGRVEFSGPFHRPTSFKLHRADGAKISFDGQVPNGFQYEIAEVARLVKGGALESSRHPLSETLVVMEILDEARRQVDVLYPDEVL